MACMYLNLIDDTAPTLTELLTFDDGRDSIPLEHDWENVSELENWNRKHSLDLENLFNLAGLKDRHDLNYLEKGEVWYQ